MYSGVPYGTLYQWAWGPHPLLDVPRGRRQWSFANVVEARVLKALRVEHSISLGSMRKAVRYLKRAWRLEHPLISERLKVCGANVLFDAEDSLIDLSRSPGQLVVREVFEEGLRAIGYEEGFATRIRLDGDRGLILLDPRFRFGRPFIAGTSVPVEALWKRRNEGESVRALAQDYDLEVDVVRHAITTFKSLPRHAA
jgi:uncharacterized protein (DUF433 family)